MWELYSKPGMAKVSGPEHSATATPNSIMVRDALGENKTIRMANGQGIDFGAATTDAAGMTSELFDDYEEGTFTPTVTGSSTAGAPSGGVISGNYTKIGNRVLFNMYLYWTSHTGSGNLLVGGLPFTSNSSATAHQVPVSLYNTNYAMTAGNVMQAAIPNSATTINMRQVPSGGGGALELTLDTSAIIQIAGQYFV